MIFSFVIGIKDKSFMRKIFNTILFSFCVLFMTCNDEIMASNVAETIHYNYGQMGNYTVAVEVYSDGVALLHPVGWSKKSTPFVVFQGGGNGHTLYKSYEAFLRFIASHGYTAVNIPRDKPVMPAIKKMFTDYGTQLDKSRFGVIGWSNGGGAAYRILFDLIQHGYGKKGRFLFAMDAWIPQYMDKAQFHKLSNVNVVLMQFLADGGVTDPTIPLTCYKLMDGKGVDKNYIVVREATGHGYFLKPIADIPGVVKPLDALMEYTFTKKCAAHHRVALEGPGKTDPHTAHFNGDYYVVIHKNRRQKYPWTFPEAARDQKGFDKSRPSDMILLYGGENINNSKYPQFDHDFPSIIQIDRNKETD